jgi:hypothetical protein
VDAWIVIKTVVLALLWVAGALAILRWAMRTPAERRALAKFATDLPTQRGLSTVRIRRNGELFVQILYGSTRPPSRAYYKIDKTLATLIDDDRWLRPRRDL